MSGQEEAFYKMVQLGLSTLDPHWPDVTAAKRRSSIVSSCNQFFLVVEASLHCCDFDWTYINETLLRKNTTTKFDVIFHICFHEESLIWYYVV